MIQVPWDPWDLIMAENPDNKEGQSFISHCKVISDKMTTGYSSNLAQHLLDVAKIHNTRRSREEH